MKRAELIPERQAPPTPPRLPRPEARPTASRSSSEASGDGHHRGDDQDDEGGNDDLVLEECLKALRKKPGQDVVPAGQLGGDYIAR